MKRTGSPTVAWLAKAAGPDVPRLAAAVALGSVAQLCTLIIAGGTAYLIAIATGQSQVLLIAIALIAVRLLGAGRAALRYAERLVGQDAADRVLTRTRLQVYLDLERSGPAGTARLRGGDLLSRILGDVDAVQDLLVRGLLPMLVASLTGVLAVVGLTVVHPIAGLVLAIGLLVGGVGAPYVTRLAAGVAERRLAPAREELTAPTVEMLNGAADLEAYRATERWLERINAGDAALTKLARRTAAGSGIGAAIGMLALGCTVGLEAVTAVTAIDTGTLGAAWLPVLVLVPLAAFELVNELPAAVRHLEAGLGAADRLRRLADLSSPPIAGGTVELDPRRPIRVQVEDLEVAWPDAERPALTGVDLDLRPGLRIGVVGESGAGKTTLVTALLGFLAARTGQIRLGGVPIADVSERSLRKSVGVCAQDAHVFDSTIRNNLLIARPDATLHEMADALRRARLWDWVEQLPLGLDTPVGERGVRLSGGERQRLTLARTLLADPAVLLLDEPTAHLDEPTAAALMRDLLVATAGRTTLLVTHRLAGLSVVDEILVLSEGRIIQRGTPTELMENAGPYRKMWFRAASSASSLTGRPVG